MIRKIYSKVDPAVLLHTVYTHEPSEQGTKSRLTESTHFLQAVSFSMPAGAESRPHKHNAQERVTSHTHEALLVFKGSIELSIYDVDNTFLEKINLNEGDCYIIFAGGHSIRALTPAHLFEFKNGPYNGPDQDRTFLN
ncbi:MAG: hypothetical protein AABX53_02765 [Nanoarchaeota archaeon]